MDLCPRIRPVALFDAYVVVDWSGNSTPKVGRDSIWIAHATRRRTGLDVVLTNPRTRGQAYRDILELLRTAVRDGQRVLIGFDFPFGYPAGFAQAVGLHGEPWRAVWRELARLVVDAADNGNNRWAVAAELNRRTGAAAGPFWNGPTAALATGLRATREAFPLACGSGELQEYRIAEQHLRATGRLAHSCWKLYTAGSVGSQALLGIPVLERLRSHPDLAEVSAVWPFETGFALAQGAGAGAAIVHAEIWPGAFPRHLTAHQVKDAAQVSGLATVLAELDERGELAAHFIGPAARPDVAALLAEEGWILGA
jgi:hypothetical protein